MLDEYHILHTPSSTITNGVAQKYGSSFVRSTTGPSKTRSKVSPPSSLTATPTELRYGTVTPWFQPL